MKEYIVVKCTACNRRFGISKQFWLSQDCPPNFLGFLDSNIRCCKQPNIEHDVVTVLEHGDGIARIGDKKLRRWKGKEGKA
jgi:hypothetical protein